MEKIYPHLKWLEICQAVDWLQILTESPVDESHLLALCDSKQCAVYVDLKQPVKGQDEETWLLDVTGHGIQKVRNPLALINSGLLKDVRVEFFGRTAWRDDKGAYITESIQWDASVVMRNIFPKFKPDDIRALAHKLNGVATPPTAAEFEDLRDQLSKSIESRESAWHLTDKYKVELEALRETAAHDQTSRETARLRAEQVEKQLSELEKQLSQMEARSDHYQDALEAKRAETAELMSTLASEQAAREAAESHARELRDALSDKEQARMAEDMERAEIPFCECAQDDVVSPSSVGITFPYATKQLEAMRDAALAHWAEHDRSKPAPYGIQKKVASFLSDRIGDNSRKLPELAGAIKPDDLPKA